MEVWVGGASDFWENILIALEKNSTFTDEIGGVVMKEC
jgi:hypothetical protein